MEDSCLFLIFSIALKTRRFYRKSLMWRWKVIFLSSCLFFVLFFLTIKNINEIFKILGLNAGDIIFKGLFSLIFENYFILLIFRNWLIWLIGALWSRKAFVCTFISHFDIWIFIFSIRSDLVYLCLLGLLVKIIARFTFNEIRFFIFFVQ